MKKLTSWGAAGLCLAGLFGTMRSACAEIMYCTGGSGSTLISVDLDTGATTTIGSFGYPNCFAAAFTPDGTLWTLTGFGFQLATVDLNTGAATPVSLIGATGTQLICLESDCDGNLYGMDWDGFLYTFDKTTGTRTAVGNSGISNAMDLAFDASGTLWVLADGNLFTVDPNTAAATFRSSVSTGSASMGLVIDNDDNFFVTTYSISPNLYALNPATGATSIIGPIATAYAHGGDVMTSCGSTNNPPVADAGEDQTIDCAGPSGASVTLDATGSYDPDGDAITYEWFLSGNSVGTGAQLTLDVALGTHVFTLVVTDSNGASDSDDVTVTVQDLNGPTISGVSATPNVLWPPNHKMRTINVAYEVSDLCSQNVSSWLTVSSSEADSGLGAGDVPNDIEVVGAHTVKLRAERFARAGRTYTITIHALDAANNESTATVTVFVPHDQR